MPNNSSWREYAPLTGDPLEFSFLDVIVWSGVARELKEEKKLGFGVKEGISSRPFL